GLTDLGGSPAVELRTAVQQHFHQAYHPRVPDFDAGDFGAAAGDREGEPLEQRESTWTLSSSASKLAKRSVTATSFWRSAFRFSSPLLSPRSLRRLTQISKRRKVSNFSYILATRLLQ